jgi:hypothetical protein
VAIPYFRCADYIEQAVTCALAQTHADVRVLVGNDGDEPPRLPKDDRVTLVNFPTNRGAPFTQQAMLLGSPFGWYAPHGADDWTDPEYVDSLMAIDGPAKASGAVWWHYSESSQQLRTNDRAMIEFGVFDAELLRSIGGYGADRRCGQDTLLFEDLLSSVVPVGWSMRAGYHKRIRAGSLTQDPETGFGSPYRQEVVWHNRDVAVACARIGFADREAIRRYRESLVPADLRAELDDRIGMVREALS